jgi:hypothetical protein
MREIYELRPWNGPRCNWKCITYIVQGQHHPVSHSFLILLVRFRCVRLAGIVKGSQIRLFMGWGYKPTLNPLWDRFINFCWIVSFDLSSMGCATSSDATASTTRIRQDHMITWLCKPHYYVKSWMPAREDWFQHVYRDQIQRRNGDSMSLL